MGADEQTTTEEELKRLETEIDDIFVDLDKAMDTLDEAEGTDKK